MNSALVRRLTLNNSKTQVDITGLALDTLYSVTMVCIFTGHEPLDCGTTRVKTSAPDLMIGDLVYRSGLLI